METFVLQMLALIALIYSAIVTAGLIVWLIKGFISDWREYHYEE